MTQKLTEFQIFARQSIEFRIHEYAQQFEARFLQYKLNEIESELWSRKQTAVEILATLSRSGEIQNWRLKSSGYDEIDASISALFLRSTASRFPPLPAGSPREVQLRVFYSVASFAGFSLQLNFEKSTYARNHVAPVIAKIVLGRELEDLFEKLSQSSNRPLLGLVISKDGKLLETTCLIKTKSSKLNKKLIEKISELVFLPLPDDFPDPVHIIIEVQQGLSVIAKSNDLLSMGR